jgi:hypothetical protein
LENQNGSVLEEHALPEIHGGLGGKRIEMGTNGKFSKTTFIVGCDYCGSYPLEEFVICKSCRGRLCREPPCSVKLDGRTYCRSCLMELLPLSRNCYKVLMCIGADVHSVKKISDLARLSTDDVRASLALLKELKLVESKGMLAFLERKITGDGIRAQSVYSKVYADDEDVKEVEGKIAGVGNGA